MQLGWCNQRSTAPRKRLAGLLVALALSACGLTTQNPDDALSAAGTLSASGTSNSSGRTSNSSGRIPLGGRAGSSNAEAGAGATAPNATGGTTTEIIGGAPGSVSGGAPSVGGAPSAGGALSVGGAPTEAGAPTEGGAGAGCGTFDAAWQSNDCSAVIEAELQCREICDTVRQGCFDNCQSSIGDCTATCVGSSCATCRAALLACKRRCARNAAACTAPCVRESSTCRALLRDQPGCAAAP